MTAGEDAGRGENGMSTQPELSARIFLAATIFKATIGLCVIVRASTSLDSHPVSTCSLPILISIRT
jgi:hypothetical protein